MINDEIIQHYDYLIRLATSKCSTQQDAEDLVGDTMLAAFVSTMQTPIPKHLTSVPELFRYLEATSYFVMAIVREAYEKGLHLKDVDYCCPPVVLVYEV